jgi:hypothetical protein
VLIKLAATTLEVKERIEKKWPDNRLPCTDAFAYPTEERHTESIKFLDREFKIFAQFFTFLIRTYMSLASKTICNRDRAPDGGRAD